MSADEAPVATTITDHIALWARWRDAIEAEADAAMARAEAAGRRLATFDGYPDHDDDDTHRLIVRDYRTGDVLLDVTGSDTETDKAIDRAEGAESWVSVDDVRGPVYDRLGQPEPVLRLPGLPDGLCDLIGDAVAEWADKVD